MNQRVLLSNSSKSIKKSQQSIINANSTHLLIRVGPIVKKISNLKEKQIE